MTNSRLVFDFYVYVISYSGGLCDNDASLLSGLICCLLLHVPPRDDPTVSFAYSPENVIGKSSVLDWYPSEITSNGLPVTAFLTW